MKNPTALELWFDGSYVGKYGTSEVFRWNDNNYYLVRPDLEPWPMADGQLKVMFR